MNKPTGTAKTRSARVRGFTLIELLIVMAVVAILAVLAYPSYTDFIRKSRRTDATTDLMEAAQVLERCYTQLGNVYDDPGCPIQSTVEIRSSEGFYRVTPTVTATTYSLTATPVAEGPQAADAGCTAFTLTNTGIKTARGDLGNDCWN